MNIGARHAPALLADDSANSDLAFFLGGRDLEMVTIRELLEKETAGCFHDKQLSWSAKASAYRPEIVQILEQGRMPVLIELVNDLEEPLKSDPRLFHVDHHGSQRGLNARTALHQVFVLLGLPASRWTRWFDLVSVNDSAYLPGLVEFGATKEEIEVVRRRDRAAQGVTPEEEAEAIRAIEKAESRFGGRLMVVRIASLRTSPTTDRLEPLRPGLGAENVFIVSPGEVPDYGIATSVSVLPPFTSLMSRDPVPDYGIATWSARDHLFNSQEDTCPLKTPLPAPGATVHPGRRMTSPGPARSQ